MVVAIYRGPPGSHVEELMTAGQSVILDFPVNTRSTHRWFVSFRQAAGDPLVLHYLEASEETCLHRIAERNESLPEGAHRISKQEYRHVTAYFEPPVEAELSIQLHSKGT